MRSQRVSNTGVTDCGVTAGVQKRGWNNYGTLAATRFADARHANGEGNADADIRDVGNRYRSEDVEQIRDETSRRDRERSMAA